MKAETLALLAFVAFCGLVIVGYLGFMALAVRLIAL